MNRFDQWGEKWQQFVEKLRPVVEKVGRFFHRLGQDLATIASYMYKLRAVIICAPIAAIAVVLAAINTNNLPEQVSILMPAIDTAAEDALFGFLIFNDMLIGRSEAVLSCLILTLVCLVLTMFTKRTLYPWLIAVFTLSLPLLLRVTNDPTVVQGMMDSVSELLGKLLN